MAKPFEFSFSIPNGDPIRLATAIKEIVEALEPLKDPECRDVLIAVARMYLVELRTKGGEVITSG